MDEIKGDTIRTPELLAAAINKKFAEYNALIAETASKDAWAKLVIESKEILNKVEASDKGMTEMKSQFEQLTESMKIQGTSIAKMKTAFGPHERQKTLASEIKKNVDEGIFNDIADEKSSKAKMTIETKDIVFGTVGSTGVGDTVQPFMPFQIPQLAPMENFDVRTILPTGTIDIAKLEYPVATWTDTMDSAAENGAATESSATFAMTAVAAHRITTYINVSRTALRSAGYLSNFLNTTLMAMFVRELNRQSVAGLAGGVDDLSGLVNNAHTFVGTNFAGVIKNANYMDVLNCAAGEMESGHFITPNTILLNPIDARILASTKNTIDDFINPSTFLQSNQYGYTTIFGMRVVTTADVVAGTYCLAAINPAYMQLLFHGPVEILATDSHSTFFLNNLITIKLEAMVMLPIYQTAALIKGTLATDLDIIKQL